MADVGATQGSRAPPRVAASTASSIVIPMSRTARAMQNDIEVVLLEPGLQLVAIATRDPGVDRPAGVRIGLPGGEVGGRQERGNRAASGERRDVVVGEIGAVVDRCGADLDRELHAWARAELIAVHPQSESGGPAGLQDHRAGLLDVEGPALAEDVDPAA